jgi:hypothetical protein
LCVDRDEREAAQFAHRQRAQVLAAHAEQHNGGVVRMRAALSDQTGGSRKPPARFFRSTGNT